MLEKLIKFIAQKQLDIAYKEGYDDGNCRGYRVGYHEGREKMAEEYEEKAKLVVVSIKKAEKPVKKNKKKGK